MADKIVIIGGRVIHLDGATDKLVIINGLAVQDGDAQAVIVPPQPNGGIILDPRVTITLGGQA